MSPCGGAELRLGQPERPIDAGHGFRGLHAIHQPLELPFEGREVRGRSFYESVVGLGRADHRRWTMGPS